MTLTKFEIHSRKSENYWDVRKLVKDDFTLKTDGNFAAGELDFDLFEVNEGFVPNNGDEVRFEWDNQKIFFGHIFKVNYTSDEVFSCVAYDNMRYLKNEDSLVWPVSTLTQRFTTMCKSAGVSYRIVKGSNYKLPAKVSDGVSFFSMLQEDIESVYTATKERYFIRDNFGTVELCAMPLQTSGEVLVVGDKSIATSWEYDRSIDDAANVVKVVKNSKKDAGKTTATASDDLNNTVITSQSASSSSTISRWGKLQIVEKVNDDKMNSAQMKSQARSLLKQHNIQESSMKVTAIGSLYFKVGSIFMLKVASLGDIGIKQPIVTVQTCTQNFSSKNWTTDMEVSL